MEKHWNDTTRLAVEPPRTGDRVKLTLISGGGRPTVDCRSDAAEQRLLDALEHNDHERRRGRRLVAYMLSAASAVLGYFATLHFLCR